MQANSFFVFIKIVALAWTALFAVLGITWFLHLLGLDFGVLTFTAVAVPILPFVVYIRNKGTLKGEVDEVLNRTDCKELINSFFLFGFILGAIGFGLGLLLVFSFIPAEYLGLKSWGIAERFSTLLDNIPMMMLIGFSFGAFMWGTCVKIKYAGLISWGILALIFAYNIFVGDIFYDAKSQYSDIVVPDNIYDL